MDRGGFLICLMALSTTVTADIYLHNPRGSNNRLNEAGRQRNNANRLFDSQNNDRGGYNVGSLYYYQGSKLPIEWTNQHSCKAENNQCEIIIQYMCDDRLRDGATTNTIPSNPMNCDGYDCDTDLRYGMHEDFNYYLNCKQRERNMGLFTADQQLKGNKAIYTRQNAAGTRRGFECPEERDYYPYWHPSPWKDIAVLTNDARRCPYYRNESENVRGRGACHVPMRLMYDNISNGKFKIPNNEEDCKAWRWPEGDPDGAQAEWKEGQGHGIPAPICHEAPFSRDNHLGNGVGGYPNTFNWTLPSDVAHENCAIRIRYNISTGDYDGWTTNASHVAEGKRRQKPQVSVDLAPKYGFDDEAEAVARGYQLKNNPQVQIFEELAGFKLRLAINTAQFGRTFQDRSHSFAIRRRPGHLEDVMIHNVNVRGKRGNIVQVYPAVEYDFVPNTLTVREGDYVHYQWTGSNNNPGNNDGQGRAGSDRSNVVLQAAAVYPKGNSSDPGGFYQGAEKHGHWGRSYPGEVDEATFLGFSEEDRMRLALLSTAQFRGDMAELNDAGTYFDLGPRKVTASGIFHYMCTRNNNFSNRSQKGRIVVSDVERTQESIGWNGGKVELQDGKATVEVDQGVFEDLHLVEMEAWSQEQGEAKLAQNNRHIPVGDSYASDYISISPSGRLASDGQTFRVTLALSSTTNVAVYRSSPAAAFATWTRLSASISGSRATIEATEGGVYVARGHGNAGMIAGAVIGAVVLVAVIVAGTVVYVRKHPGAFAGISRSLTAKV